MIEGEPGIGKSSVLGAVEQALQGAGVTTRIGFADSLERSAPFQAWAAVFAELLELGSVSRADVADHLQERVGPRAPLLSPVLAIDIPDTEETASLAGEQRVTATQSLLLELLAADRDRTGSLAVLLEDAHWFDSASWGLLADALALHGVVVVITTRPDSPATRRELERVGRDTETVRIHLEPLPTDDVRRLAQASLGVAEIDDRVEAMLIETCKGNPFFVVELVQALAQRGALVVDSGTAKLADGEAVHVPTTIQAAITSRVDILSADEQLTIKVASVVGATFDVDLLAEIHPTARSRGGLAQDLRSLVDQGLIGAGHDGGYEFNHALTREVAYGLMTGDQRRGPASITRHVPRVGGRPRVPVPRPGAPLAAGGGRRQGGLVPHARGRQQPRARNASRVRRTGRTGSPVLGIELDVEPSKIVAVLPAELAEIDRLIAGRRPADLATLPELIDEEIGQGIGILLQSMPSAHQSLQTELFALMAIRNLNLTLRFGAGPLAPGVYAMYSVVLRGLGADSALAYEFSELARTVDAPAELLAPVVDFVHVWFNNHWFNPHPDGHSHRDGRRRGRPCRRGSALRLLQPRGGDHAARDGRRPSSTR